MHGSEHGRTAECSVKDELKWVVDKLEDLAYRKSGKT